MRGGRGSRTLVCLPPLRPASIAPRWGGTGCWATVLFLPLAQTPPSPFSSCKRVSCLDRLECFRRVDSGGECGAPRGRGGGVELLAVPPASPGPPAPERPPLPFQSQSQKAQRGPARPSHRGWAPSRERSRDPRGGERESGRRRGRKERVRSQGGIPGGFNPSRFISFPSRPPTRSGCTPLARICFATVAAVSTSRFAIAALMML